MKKLSSDCKSVLVLGLDLLRKGAFACIDVNDKDCFAENDNKIQEAGAELEKDKPFSVQ